MCTVHSNQYTDHSSQFTVHSTQYTVHRPQYTVHSTQYIAPAGVWNSLRFPYPRRLARWRKSRGQEAGLATGIRRPGGLLEEAPARALGGGRGARSFPLITAIQIPRGSCYGSRCKLRAVVQVLSFETITAIPTNDHIHRGQDRRMAPNWP